MERAEGPCDHFVTDATERTERKKTRHQVSMSSMSEPAEKTSRWLISGPTVKANPERTSDVITATNESQASVQS